MIRLRSTRNPQNPRAGQRAALLRIARILRCRTTADRRAPRGPPPGVLRHPVARTPSTSLERHQKMAADLSGEAAEISVTQPTRLVLTIEQAARRLGIGRTLMYSLVMTGEVESVTIGRLRRIPVECLAEYVTKLRTAQQTDQTA